MKEFFQTNEQLTDASNNNLSLYAPSSNGFLALELAYWAQAPRNQNDTFVCRPMAFSFFGKEYRALLPETWVEAQIWPLVNTIGQILIAPVVVGGVWLAWADMYAKGKPISFIVDDSD